MWCIVIAFGKFSILGETVHYFTVMVKPQIVQVNRFMYRQNFGNQFALQHYPYISTDLHAKQIGTNLFDTF